VDSNSNGYLSMDTYSLYSSLSSSASVRLLKHGEELPALSASTGLVVSAPHDGVHPSNRRNAVFHRIIRVELMSSSCIDSQYVQLGDDRSSREKNGCH